MRIKKTLIITRNCFPPVLVGPAVLMGNLFKRFTGDYCVLMNLPEEEYRLSDNSFWLPCKYYYTKFPKNYSGWLRFRSLLSGVKRVLQCTEKGLEIIKHEEIKNILLIPSYLEVLTGLLLHWITKKRLIVYLFDIYYFPNRCGSGWSTLFMKIVEPILLKSAATVIVTAEPTQKHYKKKYNVDPVILPHSVDLEKYETLHPTINKKESKEIKIVFTGEVSIGQLDSILNMVKTVNTYEELNAIFVVVANAPKKMIEPLGINGSRVIITNANRAKIPALQQSADMLFLPLSFTWKSPEIIRTASPSKMPEYLAAGRPILIHAPAYSYVANYARKEGFGLVVDRLDPGLLRQAILDLKHDGELCHRLVTNAQEVAKKHDAAILSAKLHNILQ